MAPSLRRRAVKPRSPRFFKVILNHRAERLRIPKAFAAKFGSSLPNPVFLRAPRGPEFRVELIKSNGELWLGKGWPEFRQHYSIEFGHFLTFKFHHESKFQVLVFDKTAPEIDYPLHNGRLSKSEANGDDDVSDDPTAERLSRTTKKDGEKSCLDKERSSAYRRAMAFVSDNPIRTDHFVSLMYPSYVAANGYLTVPLVIMKNILPPQKDNEIKLRSMDGSMWAVKCTMTPPIARIGLGWHRFVKDNGLKLGDALVFEVNKNSKLVWNVFIFRS
ncbi:Unknown protein [Striga hermonthica]|uniref:TF-B3 domain-containing protein n=1 Tax=Striga hermonthica TaxID=68872 RepID=A0A9N7NMN6_STRHE|nr:Unknown protein [Striga hermonthica]